MSVSSSLTIASTTTLLCLVLGESSYTIQTGGISIETGEGT